MDRVDKILATVKTSDSAIAAAVDSITALGSDLVPELITRVVPPRAVPLTWAQMLCLVRALAAHGTQDAVAFLDEWASRIVEGDEHLEDEDELDLAYEALDSLASVRDAGTVERLRRWLAGVDHSWDSTLVWHLIDAFRPHAKRADLDLLRRFTGHADWDVAKAANGAVRRVEEARAE